MQIYIVFVRLVLYISATILLLYSSVAVPVRIKREAFYLKQEHPLRRYSGLISSDDIRFP